MIINPFEEVVEEITKATRKQLLQFLLLLFTGAMVMLAGYYLIYGHGPF